MGADSLYKHFSVPRCKISLVGLVTCMGGSVGNSEEREEKVEHGRKREKKKRVKISIHVIDLYNKNSNKQMNSRDHYTSPVTLKD